MLRTSGIGSSSVDFRSGSSIGRYGTKSRASLTIVQMFPDISAAYLFVVAARSLNPLCTTGMMMLRLGASIAWTNSVDISASRARSVPDASVSALSNVELMEDISGFLITLHISSRASSALLFTLGWVSLNASVSLGTTCGRHFASCLGAQWDIDPSMWMDACFVLHSGSANASRTAGMTSLTPCPDRLPMMSPTVRSAAART
mmetsp:Transcript_57441/g.121901  ORF Transcript_57441/g.121901 Transcript_57441/m.121901 type:complete len:203 (-) Transcript_57441:2432-3040(-)